MHNILIHIYTLHALRYGKSNNTVIIRGIKLHSLIHKTISTGNGLSLKWKKRKIGLSKCYAETKFTVIGLGIKPYIWNFFGSYSNVFVFPLVAGVTWASRRAAITFSTISNIFIYIICDGKQQETCTYYTVNTWNKK